MLQLQRLAGNRAVTALFRAGSGRHLAPPGGVNVQRDAAATPGDPTGLGDAVAAEPVARINEAEQSALARLTAAATTRRAEVAASFGTASQQAEQSFRAFEAQSKAGEAADTAEISATGTGAKAAIRQQAATTETRTQGVVGRLESAASAAAGQETARARSVSAEQQQRAIPAVGAASDEEVRQGKTKIAATVEGKAKTELSKAGDQAAASVAHGQQQMASKLYGPAKAGATGKVKAAAAEADQAMDSGRSTAQTAVHQITGKAINASANAKRTVTQGVASGQRLATADVAAWDEAGRTKISASAEQFRTEILNGARQFEADAQAAQADSQILDTARTEMHEGLRHGAAGMVAALTESGAGLDDGMAQLSAQHLAGVAASSQQTKQQVVQLGYEVRSGQQTATRGFRSTADSATAEAKAQFAAVPDRLDAQLAGPHRTGVEAIHNKVDEVGTKASRWAD
ncbi:MAG: hypothetical protein L0H24_11485, partial [Microlunatus sp.]|nr:hypothetical protein [Microlunatus sp.]